MQALGRGIFGQGVRELPRFYRAFATQASDVFSHYLGPGGLRRVDARGNIEVFNRNVKNWTKSENRDLQRMIVDATPVSEEEASAYVQRFNERKVESRQ